MENKAFGEDVNEGNALSGGRRIKFEDTESNGSSKRMPENVYREVDASSSGTENNSSPSKRPGTSPVANKAFILSKNADDSTLVPSNSFQVELIDRK